MKVLRNLILCGCTNDTPTRCAHRTWLSNGCLCPCHFSNEQTQRLLSAYISNGPQFAGFLERRLGKPVATTSGTKVTAGCGHDLVFEQAISKMAMQYVQQNRCDSCQSLFLDDAQP